MNRRSIALVAGVSAVYCVIFSVISVQLLDTLNIWGMTHVVQAYSVTGQTSSPAALKAVESIATQSNTSIAKETIDLADPEVRHLYLIAAPGSRESKWARTGYPWFSPDSRVEIHGFSDAASFNAGGTYDVFGGSAVAEQLAAAFKELGYEEVSVSPAPNLSQFLSAMAGEPLGMSFAAMMLLLLLASGTLTITDIKNRGVLRLHGFSPGNIVRRDGARAALPWLTTLAVVGSCTGGFLWWYNDFHQASRLCLYLFGSYVGALSFVGLGYAFGTTLIMATPILENVKGRMPWSGAAFGVYLIRIPVTLMVATSVLAVLSCADSVASYEPTRQAWTAAGRTTRVIFGGSVAGSEIDARFKEAGSWVLAQENAGNVVVAIPVPLDDGRQALIVNDAYLRLHPEIDLVVQQQGNALDSIAVASSDDDGGATLESTESLLENISSAPVEDLSFSYQKLPPDQRLFTYSTDPRNSAIPAFLTNPVVIVVNGRTGVISEDDYASYASQGRALFLDLENAVDSAPDALKRDFIDSFALVAQDAADENSRLVRELQIQVANVLISFLLLVVTALAMGSLYARTRGQRILVQYLHGWSFSGANRRLILLEAALAVIVTGVAFLAINGGQSGGGVPSPGDSYAMFSPAATCFLAILSMATTLAVVAVYTRRAARTRADEDI